MRLLQGHVLRPAVDAPEKLGRSWARHVHDDVRACARVEVFWGGGETSQLSERTVAAPLAAVEQTRPHRRSRQTQRHAMSCQAAQLCRVTCTEHCGQAQPVCRLWCTSPFCGAAHASSVPPHSLIATERSARPFYGDQATGRKVDTEGRMAYGRGDARCLKLRTPFRWMRRRCARTRVHSTHASRVYW